MKEDKYKDFELFLAKFRQLLFKRQNQDIDPSIITESLRMAVVLVGRPEVVLNHGCMPYLRYICGAFKKHNINIFYLLARGNCNITIANEVAEELERTKVVEETDRFQGESHRSDPERFILIRLEINGDNTAVKEILSKTIKEYSRNRIKRESSLTPPYKET